MLIKLLDPEQKERIAWQRKADVFTTINGIGEKSGKFESWPLSLLNSSSGLFRVPPPLNWIPAVLKDPFVPSLRDAISLVPFGAFCMQLRGNNEIIEHVLKRQSGQESVEQCTDSRPGGTVPPAPPAAASILPLLAGRSRRTEEEHSDMMIDLAVWQKLDEISGQELLDAFGVSRHYQQHVMAFCANAILNVPLEEVSGAALVSWFRKLVGRPGVRLGFVDGGLGTVLEPVGDFLAKKSEERKMMSDSEDVYGLHMGAHVTRVERKSSIEGEKKQFFEVHVTDTATGQQSVLRPKHGVVITLPPLEALKLIPEQDRDKPLQRLLRNVDLMNNIEARGDREEELQEGTTTDRVGEDDTPASVLSRFRPCKYVSVYLWFDADIRRGT